MHFSFSEKLLKKKGAALPFVVRRRAAVSIKSENNKKVKNKNASHYFGQLKGTAF
jgi:hypothetical protein